MKKELSANGKILRSMVIGVAVYCGAYLLSLAFLSQFVDVFTYNTSTIGTIASFVAGTAGFLSIKAPDKSLLLYNPSAIFIKKPYFWLFTILTSISLTIVFNNLFSVIPWEIFGDKHVVQNNEVFYSLPFYYRIVAFVLIGPFAEEVLFRGIIFSGFRKLTPLWAAAGITSLFFGIYHGNLMQGIYAFCMGMVMCMVLNYGGSFFYPLLFHITANMISNLCAEFEPVNKAVYSALSIAVSGAYLVVAIIISYVFKDKLTKKDKKC